jgi:hypothetical protein
VPFATEHDTAATLRLTSVTTTAAEPPESGEISLEPYEGSAIVVRGVDEGEWVYSAMVIEQAGLILTAVVQQVFGAADTQHRLQYPLAWN